MKKILAMLLALSMGCTMLAACGEEDSSSKKDKDPSSVTESVADDSSEADDSKADDSKADESSEPGEENKDTMFSKLLAQVDANKALTMSVEAEGQLVYLTADSENTYLEMKIESNEEGFEMSFGFCLLVTPDGSYIIDTENKKYFKDDEGSLGDGVSNMEDSMMDFDAYEYISTETKTIEGAEYTVEKYLQKAEYEGEEDEEISFAFNDSGELCYMVEGAEYMPYVFTATADTAKFSVDGYTAMTADEFEAWSEESGVGFLLALLMMSGLE